jgi:Ca-activated chloride channel homolog
VWQGFDCAYVVNFNEHVRFGLPENQLFTDQVPQLEVALSTIITNGQTALYDAVAAALEHLKKGDRDKKVLIVTSDGGDNASRHGLAQIMAMTQHAHATIYTIGLFDEEDDDRNPRVLRQLAEATGGDVFLPKSLNEVVHICKRIAGDIRNQFTIAYVPANTKQDGSYRSIQVTASAPGRGRLSVKTRAGYLHFRNLRLPRNRITHEAHWGIADVYSRLSANYVAVGCELHRRYSRSWLCVDYAIGCQALPGP